MGVWWAAPISNFPKNLSGGFSASRSYLSEVVGCVWPIRSGYDVLRVLLATVLLVAAGLKCHQLATEPILGASILDNRWFLMATVEFELFFGLWLLSNNLPKLTWLAALGCFNVFTCVSLSDYFERGG